MLSAREIVTFQSRLIPASEIAARRRAVSDVAAEVGFLLNLRYMIRGQ